MGIRKHLKECTIAARYPQLSNQVKKNFGMASMPIPIMFGSDQAWANPEKFSGNPENTDNYFWEIYTYI